MSDSDDIAAIAAALGCAYDAAARLRAAGHLRNCGTGDMLAYQGDIAQTAWLVLDGAIRCETVSPDGRATVIAAHGPGDLIGGWTSSAQPLAGALMGARPSLLLALPVGAIERIGADDAVFALAIAHSFARQAEQLLARFAARNSLTAPGRLYARLVELADANRVISPAPIVAALATSVQTTRETASRALSIIERRGILARQGDQWVIQSLRLLEELIV
jgi:CRP/FNR family transcriptional regulator, cyclic AMP receptor protein